MPSWTVNLGTTDTYNEASGGRFNMDIAQDTLPRVNTIETIIIEFDIGSGFARPGEDFSVPAGFVFIGNVNGRARYSFDASRQTQPEFGFRITIINDSFDEGTEVISVRLVSVTLRDGSTSSISSRFGTDTANILDDDGISTPDPMPDLTISDILTPSSITTGESFDISLNIRNIGEANVSSSQYIIDIQDNSGSSVLWSSGWVTDNQRVVDGGTVTTSAVTIPASISAMLTNGSAFVTARTRTTGATEIRTDNNTRTETIGVEAGSQPNLSISNISLSKYSGTGEPQIGDEVKINFTTNNTGDEPVGSTVARIELIDNLGRVVDTGTITVPGVAVGGTWSSEYRFTIPVDAQAGTFSVRVTADITNLVTESNENDNIATSSVVITEGNSPPVANNDNINQPFERDGSYFISDAQILANDSDPNGDALSLSAWNLTRSDAGGSWVRVDDGFIGRPTDAGGVMILSYTVVDADGLSDTAIVVLRTGAQPNRAPTANYDTIIRNFEADGSYFVSDEELLRNDTDPDGDILTISDWNLARSDAGGSWTRVDGGFIATPTGESDSMVMAYRVSDPSGDGSWAAVTFRPPSDPAQTSYTINPASPEIEEEGGLLRLTIIRSLSDSEQTVYVTTVTGSASSAAGDYAGFQQRAVTFSAGSTQAVFFVRINDDDEDEGAETFQIIVQDTLGAPISDYEAISNIVIADASDATVYQAPTFARYTGTSRSDAIFRFSGDDTQQRQDSFSLEDTSDIFTIFAERAGTATISFFPLHETLTGPYGNTFTIELEAGENRFVLVNDASSIQSIQYDLTVAVEYETNSNNDDALLFFQNLFSNGELAVDSANVFFDGLQALALVLDEAEIVQTFKFLNKVAFGPVGRFLDLGERGVRILDSKNKAHQTIAEVVDLVFEMGAIGRGAGEAVLRLPKAIKHPYVLAVAGIFGGAAGQLIYSQTISDDVRQGVLDYLDALENGGNGSSISIYQASASDIDFSPYLFDEDYYIAEHPEVIDAIADGTVSSAYFHYLAFGVQLGHAPNDLGQPLSENDITINLELFDPAIGFSSSVLSQSTGSRIGDQLSSAERDLGNYLNAIRQTESALNIDDGLSAVANRIAQDWILNNGDVLQNIDRSDLSNWAEFLSTGENFRQALQAAVGQDVVLDETVHVAALVSGATNPQDVLELFLNDPQTASLLLGIDQSSIGIAEFGGLWVLIIDDDAHENDAIDELEVLTSRQFGGIAAEVFYGGFGNSSVYMGDGADTFVGGVYNDIVFGQDGDDTFFGSLGNDTFDGGNGFDTLDYSQFESGIQITSGSSLISVERIIGSAFNDTIWVRDSIGGDEIFGGAGNDNLSISALRAVDPGQGIRNYIYGGAGDDRLDLFGFDIGADLFGGAGDDDLDAGIGEDRLFGGDGDDKLEGGGGDDWLDGGAGADSIFGDDGYDVLDYSQSDAGVRVSLGTASGFGAGFGYGGHAQGDRIWDIEHVIGSSFSDRFWGYDNNDRFDGGDGDDFISSGGGNDILLGGIGNDTLFGGLGRDNLYGGSGDDILEGGGGPRDNLFGGAGNDTASYTESTNRVVINMAINLVSSGHATGDVFDSIENITGSNFSDILTGDRGANVIIGGEGFDVISGFSGDDIILGGSGNDFMTGGAGADIIDGGDGSADVARYVGSTTGVYVNLGAGTASGGDAEGDIILNTEFVFGSTHDDLIIGDDANNWLYGDGGSDTLAGGAGIDKLFGGTGADIFVMSAGHDFVYVTDFGTGNDSIDLSSYDFSDMAEALTHFDQRGAHLRFFNEGDTMLILNSSLSDVSDAILI